MVVPLIVASGFSEAAMACVDISAAIATARANFAFVLFLVVISGLPTFIPCLYQCNPRARFIISAA
jgi:hypothetical protein